MDKSFVATLHLVTQGDSATLLGLYIVLRHMIQ